MVRVRIAPLFFILLLAVVLVLSSCSARNAISTDYNSQANFAEFRSFAWMPGEWRRGQRQMKNVEFVHREISQSIEKTLSQNGYTQSSGVPDFWVAYNKLKRYGISRSD